MGYTSEYSYCSWCFDKTEHKLIERNITSRNIYKCSECGNRTVMCRACKNMAKGGKWDDELCAEHDGTIVSFERYRMQIRDITDYELLMKRDSTNVRKAVKILLGDNAFTDYFNDIEGFSIERLKQGIKPGIVCIDGFLTEGNPEPIDWKAALSVIYPNNAWYYVRWESKKLLDLCSVISNFKPNAKGYAIPVVDLALNPWTIAMKKADQTGVLLADILSRTNSQYILCGHSLGARVIYYALSNLSAKKENKFVYEAHLLGGAIGNQEKDWADASRVTIKGIKNYYSTNDWVLATLYKLGSLFCSDPVGRNPINPNGHSIINYDVSNMVCGHTEFKDVFHNYAVV